MDEQHLSNQQQAIIDYMTEYGSITSAEAMQMGIFRLASRISELKEKGFPIKTDKGKFTTKYGKKGSFAVYILEV